MRARSFALAMLACGACAETQETAPMTPMALLSDMLLSLSQVQADGALFILDPSLVARPAFDADRSAKPEYPVESLRAFEHGEVTLELCVSEDGHVADSAIATSSRHERLDQASLAWVNSATFTPARTAEGPVAVCGYTMSYVWKLEQSAFPPMQLLANAYALGVSPVAPGPGEVWLQLDGAVENVERPVLKYAPPAPVHPGQAGAPSAPFRVDLCISSEGRPVAVEGLEALSAMEGAYAINWLNGLRFEPATRHGEPVNVCGWGWQMRWRQAS